MERLFVYGTLRPGHENAYILENIGGDWLPGDVAGTFYESGWGAAEGFPGLILDDHGARSSEERRVGKEGRSRWSPYH